MSIWLKAAGKWGSILAIIALVITLLKQIIGFIAFLTTAIKLLVILVFVALFVGIGFMVFRSFSQRRKTQE
jgi:ABC-type Na+ efflux pump permease subunit